MCRFHYPRSAFLRHHLSGERRTAGPPEGSGAGLSRLPKNSLPILLRDWVCPAVEFEALHCRGVVFAVVVVGRLEPNDHVPLCFVVANARNVTALLNVLTREGVK